MSPTKLHVSSHNAYKRLMIALLAISLKCGFANVCVCVCVCVIIRKVHESNNASDSILLKKSKSNIQNLTNNILSYDNTYHVPKMIGYIKLQI